MQLEEKLYTSTEVAEILGVSLRSVYRYLDEGKLNAEVKTATGRHRFTKQNILDFLYPQGEKAPDKETPVVKTTLTKSETTVEETTPVQPQPVQEPASQSEPEPELKPEPTPVVETPVKEKTEEHPDAELVEEEPVDWLEKFRAAASKYKEDIEDTSTISNISPLVEEEQVKTEPEENYYYYRSLTGGLKDIAQNIDKSARKASVEYAFTMNAGMSLHKPIKPFSILHVYIKPEDREFYERMLHLVPADETNAQLCLITSTNNVVFNTKKEMHGLFVVSDARLKKDLSDHGEAELAREFESVASA